MSPCFVCVCVYIYMKLLIGMNMLSNLIRMIFLKKRERKKEKI